MILKPILGLLWCLIHLAISLFDLWSCLSNKLDYYLISTGLLSKYQNLHLERLKCLGVVVDSREARIVMEVKQLLHWFSTIGIKYVVLYDIEGVIKESIEPGTTSSRDEETSNFSDVCGNTKSSYCSHRGMVIECLSGSDGKEGIAKAANLLYSASCNNHTACIHGYDKIKTVFTEADMACALGAVGSGGPELDLLLVYVPVRCHLGFPAWRLCYTEIMHMGPLNSMKYGSIVKVLYQFTQKHQNYGPVLLSNHVSSFCKYCAVILNRTSTDQEENLKIGYTYGKRTRLLSTRTLPDTPYALLAYCRVE